MAHGMNRSRKYHRDSNYPLDRIEDKDDCQSYSRCLNEVAKDSKILKLPCVGCVNYVKIESQLDAWRKRQDGYVW